MELLKPVGQWVRSEHWQRGMYQIVGVVKDLVMASPFEPVQPTFYSLRGLKRWLLVKLNHQVKLPQALAQLEAALNKIVHAVPFEYKFVNDEYSKKVAIEKRIGALPTFLRSWPFLG